MCLQSHTERGPKAANVPSRLAPATEAAPSLQLAQGRAAALECAWRRAASGRIKLVFMEPQRPKAALATGAPPPSWRSGDRCRRRCRCCSARPSRKSLACCYYFRVRSSGASSLFSKTHRAQPVSQSASQPASQSVS